MYKYVSTFTVEHENKITIENPVLSNTLYGVVDKSLDEVLSYYEKFESLDEFKEEIVPIIYTHYCNECSLNNIVFQIYLFDYNNKLIEVLSTERILDIININCEKLFDKYKLNEE